MVMDKDVPYIVHEGDIKTDTQFLREIKGKNPDEYLSAIDELVTATMMYNPSLYRAFMRKLTNK